MVVDVYMPMCLKLADEETEIDLAALQGLWRDVTLLGHAAAQSPPPECDHLRLISQTAR